jgi:hypothetical protein
VVVGGHLDFLYTLAGPIAAGTYVIQVDSEDGSGDGSVLQADLDDLSDAGGDFHIDTESFTLNTPSGMQGGLLLNVTKTLPMVDAGCGDTLRLRVSMPAGPDAGYFAGLQPQLTIP